MKSKEQLYNQFYFIQSQTATSSVIELNEEHLAFELKQDFKIKFTAFS